MADGPRSRPRAPAASPIPRRHGPPRLPWRLPSLVAAVATALLAACSAPPPAGEAPSDVETDAAAAGWELRLDSERSDPGEFRVQPAEPGAAGVVRVTTGPAGVTWTPDDAVDRGDFRAEARFVQHGAPVGYREAYGIFVGGRELAGPDQEYTYLLVRGTGDFLVKRRLGETTETLVDWTPHPAVARVVQDGDEPVNTLAVEVTDGETRFLVNGQEVHAMPSPEARPWGIAGLRVNHRLDVSVEEWTVAPAATADGDGPGTS